MSVEETRTLRIALLKYFRIGKPVRGAADRPEFQSYTRQQIIRMKDSLLQSEFLDTHRDKEKKMPIGMKTSGRIYFITPLGKKHLKDMGAAQ